MKVKCVCPLEAGSKRLWLCYVLFSISDVQLGHISTCFQLTLKGAVFTADGKEAIFDEETIRLPNGIKDGTEVRTIQPQFFSNPAF